MICCAKTDIGRARNINQDSLFASADQIGPLSNLFIVADGMGGHKAGDFASRFVVEHVTEFVDGSRIGGPVMVLRKAIERTNRLLYEATKDDPDKKGAGSTIVAATISDNTLYVANVGDSRLYLLRDSLEQITKDHSLVEEMVSRGLITRGSESYRSQKNIITRAMGISSKVDVDFFEVPLQECDFLLLCSDGLTNMVADEGISKILKTTDTLEEQADNLIAAANEKGGRDNIAVVLVEPQISEVRL